VQPEVEMSERKPKADEEVRARSEPVLWVRWSRCAWLLVALIALLAGYPYLADAVSERLVLAALNVVVLVAAVARTSRSRHPVPVAVALGVGVAGMQAWHILTANRLAYLLAAIMVIGLYALVIADLLAYVLRRGQVTADKLFAAVCVYLLMGLFWATLLTMVYILKPGAFVADATVIGVRPLGFLDFIYVSFGALTTAGSSGIEPAAHHARSLLVLETLTGVLYVAVLIARLTSLYGTGRAE
jgi:hypothetical protein